jgi:predicted ABC-type ATPase
LAASLTGEPWLWIVAGINGAGKTTLTRRLWPIMASFGAPTAVLNPDDVTEGILLREPSLLRDDANRRAADLVERQLGDHLNRRISVIVETVLSSEKYKPYLSRGRRKGFRIGLLYVAVSSPELAIRRVKTRVAAAGHDVPADKIRARWPRSLDNLAWFASRVDRLLVYGNDDPRGEPLLVADGIAGRVRIRDADALPEVTRRLMPLARRR